MTQKPFYKIQIRIHKGMMLIFHPQLHKFRFAKFPPKHIKTENTSKSGFYDSLSPNKLSE